MESHKGSRLSLWLKGPGSFWFLMLKNAFSHIPETSSSTLKADKNRTLHCTWMWDILCYYIMQICILKAITKNNWGLCVHLATLNMLNQDQMLRLLIQFVLDEKLYAKQSKAGNFWI